jgi:hypothetical protein
MALGRVGLTASGGAHPMRPAAVIIRPVRDDQVPAPPLLNGEPLARGSSCTRQLSTHLE